MKLFYLANVRIPTEKAHGVAIVKACEAFAKAGVETTLVVPNRRTPIAKSVYAAYDVQEIFSVKFLATIDIMSETSGRLIFLLQTISFYASLILFLLLKSRETILYTRDPGFIALRYLGYRVVFECHVIPKNRAAFFSLVRHAHRVIVISQALKRAFVDGGFAESDILVAPSGVDIDVFDIDISKEEARARVDLPGNAYIALYTGNFTTMGADKGISNILKALVDAPEILFVAVGGSDKDQERYLKEARALGVEHRVVLRGTTSQKTLAIYQKAADVLLMPFPDTPHYRNHMSPVKMFEYMASKRPIIASDLPTIREVLNETNAFLIKPGDPGEMSETFKNERINQLASALSAEAFKDVLKFDWQSRTKRIISFLR
jgi:glycosyltransferase involved in cell wall biosynthesis